MPTKSWTETKKDVETLGYYPGQLRQQVEAIQADKRLSADYKKQLIEQAQASAAIDAKATARQVYQRAKKRIERTEAELAEAREAKDAGLNWIKLQVKAQEFEARLKNPPPGKNRERVLDDLVKESIDRESRRALAMVASPYISAQNVSETTAARAALRQWQAEETAPIEAAEVEAHHAKLGFNEIENAILRAEAAVTGARHGSWSPLSEWQKDILGQTPQNTGRIVWRDELADYANATQGAPSPVPPAVLSSSK